MLYQTVKQFLKKAADSESDIYQSLLAYRQTPVTELPYSPLEMLFSSSIRGPLPCTDETLRSQVLEAQELMLRRQDEQKEVHNRKARDLKTLVNMDRVLVRTGNEPHWTEGKILAEASQPRSYIVDTGSNQLRRNRTHLKSVPHNGNGAELEAAHSELWRRQKLTVPVSPVPSTPIHFPRRSARQYRGALPKRFDGFEMN